MKKIPVFASAVLLAISSSAMADSKLSYNYAQAGALKISADGGGLDSDGYGLVFSGLVSDTLFVVGSYADVESDRVGATGFESQGFSLGLGLRSPMSPNTDFNASASFLSQDVEGTGALAGSSDDDTGFVLAVGLRSRIAASVELNGGLSYVDIFNDDETSFGIGGVFDLGPAFSLVAGYSTSSDADVLSLGARLNF